MATTTSGALVGQPGPDVRDFPCAEAWDCISRYVYTALQGGSIMHRWTADDRQMVACCNDGTRPVIFLIEREDREDQGTTRLVV